MGRLHTHRHGKSHSIRPATLRAPSWITLSPKEIEELVIAYKDRLTRFGYEMLEFIIKKYSNGKIIIINNVNNNRSRRTQRQNGM